MLDKGELLTLSDNKKYVVVDSQKLEDVNYVYIIEQDDLKNFMFCKYDGNSNLEEVVDEKLVEKLLKLFNGNLNKK